jgi:ABC-type multidrug transport system fused ATPase/permease subunit
MKINISKLANEPSIFLIKKLWHFSKNKRSSIVLFIIMFIIANNILLIGPIIFGIFISEIQKKGIKDDNISYLLLLLFALFLKEFFFWVFHGPARIIERTVAFHAMINYRRYLLNGVFNLRISWHNEHDSGDTIDKIEKAGEGLFEFGQNVFQIIEIFVRLLGTSIVLLFFSKFISLSVFICALISFFIIFQFDKILIPQYRMLNEFSNKALATVFDALSNITTVKILNIENSIIREVIEKYSASRKLYQSNIMLNTSKWFTGIMLFQSITIMPLALYIYYNSQRGISIDAGVLSTLFLYLSELMFVLFRFGNFYDEITVYKNRLVNADPIEKAFLAHQDLLRNKVNSWKELFIKDLEFKYDDAGHLVSFNNLSLTIRQGEHIAIIGKSGSGKTTFLKVIHGMYPKASALVILDNKEPIKTSFADLDLKTMLVPQEPEIFSTTIRENISLGLNFTDEQIMYAASLAAFDVVISQLPKGLESVVNEKGANLSGGQKQRLALSRALLFSQDKELILLDESTSSVDSENEYEIYQNIWRVFNGKTIIVSTHKMNLLKLFDRIIIFEDSNIIDQGTFEELMIKNAGFKARWDDFIAQL